MTTSLQSRGAEINTRPIPDAVDRGWLAANGRGCGEWEAQSAVAGPLLMTTFKMPAQSALSPPALIKETKKETDYSCVVLK